MSEYWLISAPGDKTCQQTWETMNNVTSKQGNLCDNYKMHIPDLKVGTLDQLVGLSDDLGKLDTYVESITRKVAAYLGEVLEDQRDKLQENLLANNSESHKKTRSILLPFQRPQFRGISQMTLISFFSLCFTPPRLALSYFTCLCFRLFLLC